MVCLDAICDPFCDAPCHIPVRDYCFKQCNTRYNGCTTTIVQICCSLGRLERFFSAVELYSLFRLQGISKSHQRLCCQMYHVEFPSRVHLCRITVEGPTKRMDPALERAKLHCQVRLRPWLSRCVYRAWLLTFIHIERESE